ncbi:ABC transporter permease, partial [Candidatus Poribacteria bacterium]|nr:ABC transporter permease [Candidatus Poribacteria bacterium]
MTGGPRWRILPGMGGFVLKRLLLAVPMIIGTSLLVFSIFYLSRVDPVRRYLGERSQDEALVQSLRQELGLNDPAHIRYGRFLRGVFTWDFGKSIRTRRPVTQEIRDRFPATVELALCALTLSVVFGLGAGIVAGMNRNTLWDYAAMGVSLLAVSLPVFWLGLLLSYYFSEKLGWFPLDQRLSLRFSGAVPERTGLLLVDSLLAGRRDVFVDAMRHLALPSVALA